MKYNWELQNWPNFRYSFKGIEGMLYDFALETGEVRGILKALPDDVQQEALLQTMISEAIKTSEIEGEFLSRQDVMSSIKNNLGLMAVPEIVHDQKAAGIGKLMVDLRNSYKEELTKEKLWEWHILLLDAMKGIKTGQWRTGDEPMQVISGSIGREKIHFQAPPSSVVPQEMKQFINWFNATAPGGGQEISSAPVRAAIAHLYFESIHPFEDGNGRIGRAIAEKALSQTLGRPVMLSLSKSIEANKSSYYKALEMAQQDNEISEWLEYFVSTALAAQREAKSLVNFTLIRTRFFDQYAGRLNERQLKAVNKMLDAGFDGFKGGMTAKKYISITRTSKATATRDLQELAEMGVLLATGAGRSVSYDLKL
ncbi:MAG TPA: Fic family protein [Pedobacter sp.]|uniref:Fic family protein n=1 Tax=Pedobacter sp. TaxID=1411316 RepID=UPI002BB3FA75|nr:Fic family protein [Pedobacter sp.]HMI05823.1 Fic family protein [Pedobacter sp.]